MPAVNPPKNTGQGFWSDAESYNKVTGLPVISAIRALTAKVIRNKLAEGKPLKVLSLGIGSGALYNEYFLDEIKSGALQLYGLDILESMIIQCKEQFPFKNVTLEVGSVDCFQEIFKESFDVIEAGLVLHHVLRFQELKNIFNQVHSKLDPEGIFILGDIDVECGEHIEDKLSSLEATHGKLSIDFQNGEFFNQNVQIPILSEMIPEDQNVLKNLDKITCAPLLQEVENLNSDLKSKLKPLILQNIESAKKGLEWHRSINSSRGWLEIAKETFTEKMNLQIFTPEEIRANFEGVLDNPFVLTILKN